MRIKGIIFDLDGTLLDTVQDIGESVNLALQANLFPTHPIADYPDFIGSGLQKLIRRVLPTDVSQEGFQKVLDSSTEYYSRNWNKHTQLYPNVSQLLDSLRNLKVPLAVLSNKPHAFTLDHVRHYLNRWDFSIVQGEIPGVPRKPDPTHSQAISRKWGIPLGSILFIGDSEIDFQTAKNSGMPFIGVAWGFRGKEFLRAQGVKIVVTEPFEVISHLA